MKKSVKKFWQSSWTNINKTSVQSGLAQGSSSRKKTAINQIKSENDSLLWQLTKMRLLGRGRGRGGGGNTCYGWLTICMVSCGVRIATAATAAFDPAEKWRQVTDGNLLYKRCAVLLEIPPFKHLQKQKLQDKGALQPAHRQ